MVSDTRVVDPPPAWSMSLDDLLVGTGGKLKQKKFDHFSGIGTDTRADLQGQIFFALVGDRFDAHNFLGEAVKAGAAALVVHRWPFDDVAEKSLPPDMDSPHTNSRCKVDRGAREEGAEAYTSYAAQADRPSNDGLRSKWNWYQGVTVVQVDDTLKALQSLARHRRRQMTARVLGVTGTNGKTTTKEFSAAVLSRRFRVQFSKGSYNNHWGVPLSLLALQPEHEVAIIEMGMNHLGELRELSSIAEPDVVAVTMVGAGHLEGVGSIEGVARAKSEIYEHSPSAIKIFNLDNEHTRRMYEKLARGEPASRVITFSAHPQQKTTSKSESAPDVIMQVVAATKTSIKICGEIRGSKGEVLVPVFGRHNLTNIMVATCFALACGMSAEEIWRALPMCRTTWGRNQWVELASGAQVLFDAYNANPESMREAVANFKELELKAPGQKVGIFGEMRELGQSTEVSHQQLGEQVARADFDIVCFVGPSAAAFETGLKRGGFQKKLYISDTYKEDLALRIGPVLDQHDMVLIKGSRGIQLEKVLADLKPVAV